MRKYPRIIMHACQDALLTVFKGHMVAAACMELGIDGPDADLPPSALERCSKKADLILQVAERVVRKYTVVPEAILRESCEDNKDGVHNYARVFCHLAALVSEFVDAWSEGDGGQVQRCWKFFMLHLYAERRTKYALEALRLQFQLATLPPYHVHQLTWGRFVNTHGGLGHNIPCDLHNEHVNKLFKEIISNMGANFTEEASTRAARSVSSLERIAKIFDNETDIHKEASAHSRKSDEKDVKSVVKILQQSKVLSIYSGRCHVNFPTCPSNPLSKLNWDKLYVWIKEKAYNYSKFTFTTVTEHDSEEEN